uniref:Putative secreted peptide n=1 Tax=Anopheles braziliensis TaxID=58242 RepID=A0A2M3ZMJ7_9DIPT
MMSTFVTGSMMHKACLRFWGFVGGFTVSPWPPAPEPATPGGPPCCRWGGGAIMLGIGEKEAWGGWDDTTATWAAEAACGCCSRDASCVVVTCCWACCGCMCCIISCGTCIGAGC